MPYTSPQASLIKTTGGFGSIFVNTTAAYTGSFYAIQAFTETKFLALSASNVENIDQFVTNAITLPEGVVLYGDFGVVQLSAGSSAFLYKG